MAENVDLLALEQAVSDYAQDYDWEARHWDANADFADEENCVFVGVWLVKSAGRKGRVGYGWEAIE